MKELWFIHAVTIHRSIGEYERTRTRIKYDKKDKVATFLQIKFTRPKTRPIQLLLRI